MGEPFEYFVLCGSAIPKHCIFQFFSVHWDKNFHLHTNTEKKRKG